jgi:RNA polymerase sigma-70 factor (ECF subfamily)
MTPLTWFPTRGGNSRGWVRNFTYGSKYRESQKGMQFARSSLRDHHGVWEPSGFRRCNRAGKRSSGRAVASEDAKLAERAKNGDTVAYEELVRGHQAVAFRTAYLIVGDASEAEDAAQEAFVKAYRALGSFRSGAPFRPWLLAVVTNEARNRRKAAGRRFGLALRAAREDSPGEGASPEEAAVAAERRAELLGALGSLREEDRMVIGYRYFLQLTEAETAAALGCARGTVKSRLSRALARLREKMVEDEDATG